MRKFMITVNGATYEVDVQEVTGRVAAVAPVAAAMPVAAPVAAAPAPVVAAAPIAGGEKINAPMPGTILDVKVQAGQSVKKGDVLLILEAMKMENEVAAPRDAVVAQVAVQKGATLNTGDTMIVLQ